MRQALLSLCGVAAVLSVAACNITTMRNEGQAMAPAIKDGDQVTVTRQVGVLQRGDIVVFHYPKDPSKTFVKRIIGLPGDRVSSDDGRVAINGKDLDEPYIIDEYKSHDTFSDQLVPPD